MQPANLHNIFSRFKAHHMETAKTLVHAFVTSKLDNRDALFYGLSEYKIQRLQYVLNSAARLVTLSKKNDHVSSSNGASLVAS